MESWSSVVVDFVSDKIGRMHKLVEQNQISLICTYGKSYILDNDFQGMLADSW